MQHNIEENKSLKEFNTFGVEAYAQQYFAAKSTILLKDFLNSRQYQPSSFLILGGGSNVLFTGDIKKCVVHLCNKGITLAGEDSDHYYVRVEAGELWDDFVSFCLRRDMGGIENLVSIPGSTGAAPIQNIGAYGAEVKEVIEEVEFISLDDIKIRSLRSEECEFGYRTSIFKNRLKGSVIITSVLFKLTKEAQLKIEYGSVKEELSLCGISDPDIRDVAKVIKKIRGSKLPNPEITGNAGSFFKNPVISAVMHDTLKKRYSLMPSYPLPGGIYKVAAGWLIDSCGLKGFRMGNAAVHDKQALVLTNCGGATGAEVLELSEYITGCVFKTFGIELEPEVNIL